MKLNDQAAFNRAYRWAAKHEPCGAPDSVACLYIRDDGNRCLVGALMPKALAKKAAVDNEAICDLLYEDPDVSCYFQGVSETLLSDLQDAHDVARQCNHEKEFYLRSLRKVADKHVLTVPKIK